MAEIPCANCGAPIPAHPWAAYCTLACLIEKEWSRAGNPVAEHSYTAPMIGCQGCGRDRSEDIVHDPETRGLRVLPCPGCGSTTITTTADDVGLVEHIVLQQIEPQRIAEALREQGVDIDIAFVNTNPERPGFEVTCVGCGRTAKLPFEPPPDQVALCPDCMREGRTGQP